MMGFLDRWQGELFITGSLSALVPDDYILKRVDRVLELSWLRDEVKELYADEQGRPSIDPEAALRLMLAGFFLGLIHDRSLLREAQVNLAVRWFAGYRLDEQLPHHSSLTRIRSRWGGQDVQVRVPAIGPAVHPGGARQRGDGAHRCHPHPSERQLGQL